MSTIIYTPHDRLFRSVMSDLRVVKDVCFQALPKKILDAIQFDSLIPCAQTYVSEELKMTQTDVLYKANIAGQGCE